MKVLIDAGADIHASRVTNALYNAIRSRNIEAVQLLLTNGLKAYDDLLCGTPLHTAASCNSAPILSLLIEHGIGDISAVNNDGLTALHNACPLYFDTERNDTPGILAVLLDHGAAIDQLSRDGKSTLYYAVRNGKLPAVTLLLDRGANAALVDSGGQTALHFAYSADIVTALLAHGALVNAVKE